MLKSLLQPSNLISCGLEAEAIRLAIENFHQSDHVGGGGVGTRREQGEPFDRLWWGALISQIGHRKSQSIRLQREARWVQGGSRGKRASW